MSLSVVFFNWYIIVIYIIFFLGIISFFSLPKNMRASAFYWLPFLILVLTVTYETMGGFFIFYKDLNAQINAFLGNTENPRYNVWVFNIFNIYLLTIFYLFLIRQYYTVKYKKFINGMLIFYLLAIFVLNFTGLEKVYDSQPILFFISATFLIIASGGYFIMFLQEDVYLEVNPLRLFSFWQVTFILFNYSVLFLLQISQKYMWENHYSLFRSLTYINMGFGIIILLVFSATLAWPCLKWNYENQPRDL
jgi:hypothetical protein